MIRPILTTLLLAALVAAPLARAEETAPPASTPESINTEINAPPDGPAETAHTNARPNTLVAMLLGAGTGALILSGVDWSSDDEAAQQPADAPQPRRPSDGEALAGPTITFTWNSTKDAAAYLVEVQRCDESENCADFRLEQVMGTTLTMDWPPAVLRGRWRVRAVNAERIAGSWSPFHSFTITPTPAP